MAARKRAAERSRGRFAIYDAVTGRKYVLATFLTEADAESELIALLRPYSSGSEWHARLCVRGASGCGVKCPSRGLTCNLMFGHEGPHQEVVKVSPTRAIVHTFPGVQ